MKGPLSEIDLTYDTNYKNPVQTLNWLTTQILTNLFRYWTDLRPILWYPFHKLKWPATKNLSTYLRNWPDLRLHVRGIFRKWIDLRPKIWTFSEEIWSVRSARPIYGLLGRGCRSVRPIYDLFTRKYWSYDLKETFTGRSRADNFQNFKKNTKTSDLKNAP